MFGTFLLGHPVYIIKENYLMSEINVLASNIFYTKLYLVYSSEEEIPLLLLKNFSVR
jgi:hypothetical protein